MSLLELNPRTLLAREIAERLNGAIEADTGAIYACSLGSDSGQVG